MADNSKKTYLPSEMAAEILALAVNGPSQGVIDTTNLDELTFGELDTAALVSLSSKTCATDPKWYESIAEAIQTLKIASAANYNAADEGKVVQNGAFVAQTAFSIIENGQYSTTAFNEVSVNVPLAGILLSDADERKVVQNGVLIRQAASSYNANGMYNTTIYGDVTINVPINGLELSDDDNGKIVQNGNLASQTSFTIIGNGTYSTVSYSEVTISVPISGIGILYGAVNKVVQNGALVSKTLLSVSENGIIDTTSHNPVIVDVNKQYGVPASDVSSLINGDFSIFNDEAHLVSELRYSGIRAVSSYSVILPVCTTIHEEAFYESPNLVGIDCSNCTEIWSDAFYRCSNLSEINFPNCKSIHKRAFYSCRSLSSVLSFPECTYLGGGPFGLCDIEEAYFPKCSIITHESQWAGNGLYDLDPTNDNIDVYINVGGAFDFCNHLKKVYFPMCEIIDDGAFPHCTSLSEVDFPKCTYLGPTAFAGCGNLSSISFPVCEFIGSWAFQSCTALTVASFPNCKTMGKSVFSSCYLKSLYLLGSQVVEFESGTSEDRVLGMSSVSTLTIYVPQSLLWTYRNKSGWSYYSSCFSGVS